MRITILITIAALSLTACASVQYDAETGRAIDASNQRYGMSEVKRRAKRLQAGMPRAEVGLLLGSPARRDGDTWLYLPEKDGLLVPSKAMRVYFERGVYVRYKFEPIVFGQRVGE